MEMKTDGENREDKQATQQESKTMVIERQWDRKRNRWWERRGRQKLTGRTALAQPERHSREYKS